MKKKDMLVCGVDESNTVDVHEIATYDDIIVPIKDSFGGLWHYYRIQRMDFVTDHFAL